MKKHTVEKSVAYLKRQGIMVGGNSISLVNGDPGIKTWGHIDFLVNHHNYKLIRK